jgi:hypothetical protein
VQACRASVTGPHRALRTEAGLAALREAAACHLSPAGQLQVATALDMSAALETCLGYCGQLDLDAGDFQFMVDAVSGMLNLTYGPWRSEDVDRMLADDRPGPPG